jgi:hypothetical protein
MSDEETRSLSGEVKYCEERKKRSGGEKNDGETRSLSGEEKYDEERRRATT